MKNPDYNKFYKIYKKLPKILAVVVALLMWIWSIIDVTCFIYQSNSYYSTVIYYGVMRFTSRFPALLIWWLIGAVLAFATYFFSAMHVSAIVLRTDAVLEINAKVKETPAEKQQNDQFDIPRLTNGVTKLCFDTKFNEVSVSRHTQKILAVTTKTLCFRFGLSAVLTRGGAAV